MKVLKWWSYCCMLICLLTCGQELEQANGNEQQTVESNEIMDVIRNPATASGEVIDTSQLAKLVFSETTFDFGEVDAGAVIKRTFKFTNDGQVPLIISDVRSTCGCTVADWPKAPIAPGEQGEIPVKFDTKGKNGRQNKPITITANTLPSKTVIYLDGRVYNQEDNS